MSGSGRKTHYRKSVTEEFLHGLPVPEENEVICKTHSSRGTNIFEVLPYVSSSPLLMLVVLLLCYTIIFKVCVDWPLVISLLM
jgi:hypothetical protein